MSKIYSNILKTIVLPVADKAMKTSIATSYYLIKKLKHLSSDEIIKWQNQNLYQLIDHAYTHTKFYKRVFDAAGIQPKDIKSRDDLAKLPALTKELIREYFDDIVPDNLKTIPYKKSATGGSTGDPMVYWLDNRSWSMMNADKIFNWEKVGYNYGDQYIALGSSSLFINKQTSLKHEIYYLLKSKISLNGVNMSDEVCKKYLALIRKNKIRFIYGYASAIYLLAKYALSHSERLNICACFPTSEVLTAHFRNTIQKAFDCAVLDSYGASDGGVMAFSLQPGYFEVGYNCIVRIAKQCQNGQGAALITDLFNFAMPLINYQLGDEYEIDESRNKNFPYNGQVINRVLGRTSDIIQLENGNTLTGPGFTILFKDLPVEHYCIEKDGANSIKCSIVKLPGFNQKHEVVIISTFKKQMGPASNITLNYIDEIPLTKSGKRQYFIN
jgi:phenylacetate-CoA ligase